MMTYPHAAAGLKTVYQARLVGLISIVLVIVPIVQVLAVAAMLIAGFLALVGLAQCRKDEKGYRTALPAWSQTWPPAWFLLMRGPRGSPAFAAIFYRSLPMYYHWLRCTLYALPPIAY